MSHANLQEIDVRCWTSVAALLIIAVAPGGHAGAQTDTQIINGSCGAESHIAEGRIGEDLSKRQARFFCDSAVISFFDRHDEKVMIQFSQKESHHGAILGFAGKMESDGHMMDVERVYLEPSVATPVEEGRCKIFFKGKNMSGIFCGAKIDEGSRRTVPIVAFNAAPGQ
jgi:hypothetical protein